MKKPSLAAGMLFAMLVLLRDQQFARREARGERC